MLHTKSLYIIIIKSDTDIYICSLFISLHICNIGHLIGFKEPVERGAAYFEQSRSSSTIAAWTA